VRIVHWLFVVGVLLFVCGIGFVIAGGRAARQATTAPATEMTVVPVASVKQIMNGIIVPASTAIFDSVVITVTAAGVEEQRPRTDEEWEAVGNSAAAIIESGNLMFLGNRAVDTGDWVKMSQAMIEAGKLVLQATREQNTEKILDAGTVLNESCDSCHEKYQRGV
jgi:hypothetical protein